MHLLPAKTAILVSRGFTAITQRREQNLVKQLLLYIQRLADRGRAMLVAAIAIIVVVGVILSIRDGNRTKSLDEGAFLDISKNIAFHFQFAHTNDPATDKFEPMGDGHDPALPLGSLRPTAYRAPGYAFFQAPFRRLGAEYVTLRIINFVLVALTLMLLYSMLATRYSRLAGLLAVIFTVCYPVLLYAASTLYPQTLSTFLMVVLLYLLDRIGPKSGLRDCALAGLVAGVSALTVPVYLLLLPIILLWLRFSRGLTFRKIVLMTATGVAVIAVWTVRNYAVFRAPVPVSTASGFMLLSGNCPNCGYDVQWADLRFPEYVYTELTGKNEVERSEIMTRAGLKFIRENPGRAFTLYVQKFLFWFHFRNTISSDKVVPGGAGAGTVWLRDLLMLVTYGPLLGVLLFRLALFRKYPLSSLETLFVALYLGGGMAYAIYATRIRYRLPFDWLLIAVDALFVAQVINRWMAASLPIASARHAEAT